MHNMVGKSQLVSYIFISTITGVDARIMIAQDCELVINEPQSRQEVLVKMPMARLSRTYFILLQYLEHVPLVGPNEAATTSHQCRELINSLMTF